MIVVDTNVLSEPLKPEPNARVLSWLHTHAEEIAITTVTVAEMRFGALRLPDGRRQDGLTAAIDRLIAVAANRVLSFDLDAAECAGRLRAEREAGGHVVSTEDTMIAAICLAGGHELATRNIRDFHGTALVLHDPWANSTAG